MAETMDWTGVVTDDRYCDGSSNLSCWFELTKCGMWVDYCAVSVKQALQVPLSGLPPHWVICLRPSAHLVSSQGSSAA